MNIGIFTGRLGRDAELRHIANGDDVSNFALAVDTGTKANPQTMWIDCQVWGKRAAAITPYLVKGTKVTVQGRVSLNEYTTKDGKSGAKIQVSCNEIDMHGSPAGATSPSGSLAGKSVASNFEDMDTPF